MIRGVTRRRDRTQDKTGTQLDLIAGRDRAMCDLQMRALRREELCTLCRKVGAARHVVGMRVRIGGEGDLEATLASLGDVLVGNPGRIDHERTAVAEVNEVGRMTETLVDERDDLRHASCTVVANDASARSDAGSSRRCSCHARIFANSSAARR